MIKVGEMSRVINVHGEYNPSAINIGRPGKWGNPYHIGRDGNRETVIRRYESFVRSSPSLMASLYTLIGKPLACYCAPLPCHGDVLVRLVKELEMSHESNN